jgi:hypothetical protein
MKHTFHDVAIKSSRLSVFKQNSSRSIWNSRIFVRKEFQLCLKIVLILLKCCKDLLNVSGIIPLFKVNFLDNLAICDHGKPFASFRTPKGVLKRVLERDVTKQEAKRESHEWLSL